MVESLHYLYHHHNHYAFGDFVELVALHALDSRIDGKCHDLLQVAGEWYAMYHEMYQMCTPSWMLARAAGLIFSPDGCRVAVNSSWFACPNASSSSLVTEPWSVVVSDPPLADLPYLQRRGQFISSPNHWAVSFARSLFGGGVCAVVAPSSSGVVPCDESE